jgi:hypothetical protein
MCLGHPGCTNTVHELCSFLGCFRALPAMR